MKTIEQNFGDWEGTAFGFGYGSGEPHVIPALRSFLAACESVAGKYDYRDLEIALGPVVAWLFINRLAQCNMLEYGTSPRFGWLTEQGRALRSFMLARDPDTLVEIAANHDDHCYPDACNCGPDGYEKGRVCENPFWGKDRRPAR